MNAPIVRTYPLLRRLVPIVVCAGLALAGYFTRDRWLPLLHAPTAPDHAEPADHAGETAAPLEQVLLSAQAQKNLGLSAKPLKAQTFWKTITVPGMVIDRPSVSDRSVVAPITGIISAIHHGAGDVVQPGTKLFTLKLLSEAIHQTQTELFKSTQEIKLAQAQRQRLQASGSAIPEARVIEVDSQITRAQVAVTAYRQELLNRGLSVTQMDRIAEGTFVNEIPIVVPDRAPVKPVSAATPTIAFELQELKIELGQQVQAGQTLCLLANHQLLAIEGRAFRDETPLLERTVREHWAVAVDFAEESQGGWPTLDQSLHITYLANSIDPESRTFRFWLPLDNQLRVVETGGRTQRLWRFRPGQRVRLFVRVAAIDNVFVLPPAAVVREGAATYVFRQNIDMFERKPVHVIYQDRDSVAVANDGSVPAGIYVAQTGAAQLNRMVKAQSGTMPKGFHIHADGSVHYGGH